MTRLDDAYKMMRTISTMLAATMGMNGQRSPRSTEASLSPQHSQPLASPLYQPTPLFAMPHGLPARPAGAHPPGAYRCVLMSAVTPELDFDPAMPVVVHKYNPGDIVEFSEVAVSATGQQRGRTEAGWVSVVNGAGSDLFQLLEPWSGPGSEPEPEPAARLPTHTTVSAAASPPDPKIALPQAAPARPVAPQPDASGIPPSIAAGAPSYVQRPAQSAEHLHRTSSAEHLAQSFSAEVSEVVSAKRKLVLFNVLVFVYAVFLAGFILVFTDGGAGVAVLKKLYELKPVLEKLIVGIAGILALLLYVLDISYWQSVGMRNACLVCR